MTILVWCCYPIVWLFSEGFASFSVSFEITMYAILDVINKVTKYLASHLAYARLPPLTTVTATTCQCVETRRTRRMRFCLMVERAAAAMFGLTCHVLVCRWCCASWSCLPRMPSVAMILRATASTSKYLESPQTLSAWHSEALRLACVATCLLDFF
jgi:hypothetical protein